jgi:hypothetical protein
MIVKIERGQANPPSIAIVLRISEALGPLRQADPSGP